MNQDNNTQGVRQVTPEEIAKVQGTAKQLTQEELQKTQVLNLTDVEKIAKLERFTSKKPAIILAIIGAFFLTFGVTFQIAQNLSAPKTDNNQVQKRKTDNTTTNKKKEQKTTLNCQKVDANNPDGTNTTYVVNYEFLDNQLKTITKTFTVDAIENNPQGTITIQSYESNYQAFLNPQTGYQITVVPNATKTQIIATTITDLETLDVTTLNPIQQSHISTSVDYPLNADKSMINTDMTSKGIICVENNQ